MGSISDEYCEACKQTVNRYFYLSDSYGQERQKKRMGHNTGEDAKVVIGRVCIDEKIQVYKPSFRKHCENIIKANEDESTRYYTQSVLNPNKNTQKAELFTSIRQVLYHYYYHYLTYLRIYRHSQFKVLYEESECMFGSRLLCGKCYQIRKVRFSYWPVVIMEIIYRL